MPLTSNLKMVENSVKTVWSDINPEMLRLIDGMPSGMSKCVDIKGGYIGK